MDKRLKDLKYYILPGKPMHGHPYIRLHERAFEAWRAVWEAEFKKLNFPTDDLANDFLRQDYLPVIAYGEEIAAVHLYSSFCIESKAVSNHKYFTSNYPSEFLPKIRAAGVDTVLSMEYLTVTPQWRAKLVGLPLADVIVGLGCQLLKETTAQAFVAPARNDYKVAQKLYTFGFDCVFPDVVNHNVSCDLVAGYKSRLHMCENLDIARAIKRLWENRTEALNTSPLLIAPSANHGMKRAA